MTNKICKQFFKVILSIEFQMRTVEIIAGVFITDKTYDFIRSLETNSLL